MNSLGQVVGESLISNTGNIQNAFLYSSGKMQDLGTLGGENSIAEAINSSGDVVGNSIEPGSNAYSHAFLYRAGVLVDLNSRISGGSTDGSTGWLLISATGINDNGQIVGDGRLNGVSHAFLLTPYVVPP